jgi:hypothetical protein
LSHLSWTIFFSFKIEMTNQFLSEVYFVFHAEPVSIKIFWQKNVIHLHASNQQKMMSQIKKIKRSWNRSRRAEFNIQNSASYICSICTISSSLATPVRVTISFHKGSITNCLKRKSLSNIFLNPRYIF